MNYLIAYHFTVPNTKMRIKTQKKDWNKTPNATITNEQVAMAKSLKKRDYTMATIILDLRNRKVFKDSLKSGKTFDELFGYFVDAYPDHLKMPEPEIIVRELETKTLDTTGSISSQ
jgi:hypothetical protein